MPEYKAPGVYIEETSRGPKPIQGVSTSTAGFVGGAERGPTNARLVTSFAEFAAIYGANADPSASYLPFAVRGFFENGGRRCYVARVDPVDDNAVIGVDDGAATGLRALAEIDEVSLLCAPDQGNKLGVAVARAMVAQAETLADRFVVLQASRDDRDAASIRSRALTRAPMAATLPLTVTRPAAIQVSIARRDPRPACASSFCSF